MTTNGLPLETSAQYPSGHQLLVNKPALFHSYLDLPEGLIFKLASFGATRPSVVYSPWGSRGSKQLRLGGAGAPFQVDLWYGKVHCSH